MVVLKNYDDVANGRKTRPNNGSSTTGHSAAGGGTIQLLLLAILTLLGLSVVMFEYYHSLLMRSEISAKSASASSSLDSRSRVAGRVAHDLRPTGTLTEKPRSSNSIGEKFALSTGRRNDLEEMPTTARDVDGPQQQQVSLHEDPNTSDKVISFLNSAKTGSLGQRKVKVPQVQLLPEGSLSSRFSDLFTGVNFPDDASTTLVRYTGKRLLGGENHGAACDPTSESTTVDERDGKPFMLWAKREYQRRKPRKHQLTPVQLADAVAKEATNISILWPRAPSLVNQVPVNLQVDPSTGGPAFDLSKPFGSWKTFFSPPRDLSLAKRPPQRTPQEPPLYVATFANGISHRGHVMSCDGKVYGAGGCLWDFNLPGGFDKLENKVPANPKIVARQQGWKDLHKRKLPVGISLCDSWCRGFYHFTHEHFPRLALVHDILTAPDDPETGAPPAYLILSTGMNGYMKDFIIDILGIPSERIKTGTHMASQMLYPIPMRCGNTFTSALYMIRQVVFRRLELNPDMKQRHFDANADDNEGVKLRVLWAERKKLSRMASNFYELKKQLEEEFDSIALFDSTVGEHHARVQVAKFFHADIVIGPHGANIANIMWMVPGTVVIEMMSKSAGNMCYYTTASRVNLTYHVMMHNAGKDGKYTLEYSDVRRHFIKAVQQVSQRFKVGAVLRNLEVLLKEKKLNDDVKDADDTKVVVVGGKPEAPAEQEEKEDRPKMGEGGGEDAGGEA